MSSGYYSDLIRSDSKKEHTMILNTKRNLTACMVRGMYHKGCDYAYLDTTQDRLILVNFNMLVVVPCCIEETDLDGFVHIAKIIQAEKNKSGSIACNDPVIDQGVSRDILTRLVALNAERHEHSDTGLMVNHKLLDKAVGAICSGKDKRVILTDLQTDIKVRPAAALDHLAYAYIAKGY